MRSMHYAIAQVAVLHGHSILRQCARLVAADRRSGAQRLHRLQVLDHAVLLRQSLGGQRQRKRHRRKQALGNVAHDDGDAVDEGLEEGHLQAHADGAEDDAQADAQTGNEADEAAYFDGNGRFHCLDVGHLQKVKEGALKNALPNHW